MNYKNKYEKYKRKYFRLKSKIQTGGSYNTICDRTELDKNTKEKNVELCVTGPWYQHGEFKTGIAPPGIFAKYDIYKLKEYFPYVKTTPVYETFPGQTSIFVPKNKVNYVTSELVADNYDVKICRKKDT